MQSIKNQMREAAPLLGKVRSHLCFARVLVPVLRVCRHSCLRRRHVLPLPRLAGGADIDENDHVDDGQQPGCGDPTGHRHLLKLKDRI